MGREDGENPYLRHLYRVNADGSGFTLVDPGNFDHNERISPTKRYIVDSYSRVDYPTKNVVRDAARQGRDAARGGGRLAPQGDGLEDAGAVHREGGGRRHRHLRQHVEAVRLRFHEEVSHHRERLSRPADREREHHRSAPAVCRSSSRSSASSSSRSATAAARRSARSPIIATATTTFATTPSPTRRPASSSSRRGTSSSTSRRSASTAIRAAASSPPRR